MRSKSKSLAKQAFYGNPTVKIKDSVTASPEEAIARGFDSLGFSMHSHVPCSGIGSLEALESYKIEILRLKKCYQDQIKIFPDGKPIYPEYLSQLFTKLQKKAGLPKCRFHDLRHLCASIMLMQGINVKICSAHLGHKDISTTLNIYSHVLPSVAKEAVQKIGDLVYEAG